MKQILTTALLLVLPALLLAEKLAGRVTETDGTPLIGVNLYWEGTTIGETSDLNGDFALDKTSQSNTLMVHYIGYTQKEITITENQTQLNITLERDEQLLSEVEISQKAPGTHISRLNPITSSKITGDELCKAACCNLAESFVTNPSVDVSYSDAATGAKQIRLLGLSGLYVQMMTENMPSFRGLASVYGLEYIPGPWMESIQVSKGTASVINGYEAITGQINVEYKKPENSEHLFVNAFANNTGRKELNLNTSVKFNDKLSTMILAHAKDDNMLVDDNSDGFLDMPMVSQLNFINRWHYEADDYVAQYGAKVINEKRLSGQKAFHEGDASAYGIDIGTNRYELFTKQGVIFDPNTGKSLGVQLSGSYHDQSSFFGNKVYDAKQKNGYLNVIFQNVVNGNESHAYSVGGSLMYDDYDEQLNASDFKREEVVAGLFAQYTYNLNNKLILLGGIRGDYHNDYDFFVTPRLHVKYNATEAIHLRANVGMGYRSANVLAENSYLLASSRTINISDNLDQEQALNAGFNATFYIPIGNKEATFSTDYFYTNFFQQVVTDVDSDPHQVSFYNLDGQSYSHALQSQITYEIMKGLDLTAAYRLTDVRITINGQLREKALTNRYKGLITASYQTPLKKWQVDFTTQFNGGGRMPDAGSWDESYAPYTVMNAQVTKYFRKWSMYIGSENLSNFTMDNPIIGADDPWGPDFDASMVWGPVHGIAFYGGVRLAIDRD